MRVSLHWDDEERSTICLELRAGWTEEDLQAAQQESGILLFDQYPSKHLIIDVRSGNLLPRKDVLQYVKRFYMHRQDSTRKLIIVGARPALKAIFGIARQMFAHLYHAPTILFADTLEEARQQLIDDDAQTF